MDLINTLGGPAGFGENSVPRNDDGNSGRIDLTEVFPDGINFFGETYQSLWINTNGNVTFRGPLWQFYPEGLDTLDEPGIFAFWTDLDTTRTPPREPSPGGTSQGTNLIWYDLDAAAGTFTVTWDDVRPFGYYSRGEPNAFQLILTDISGAAGQGPGDVRVELRYEDIGFPGYSYNPARIGYIAGNAAGDYGMLGASGYREALLLLPERGPISFTSDSGGITGSDATAPILGTPAGETILGTDGANAIRSGGGDDVIRPGLGGDIVTLQGGHNEVAGTLAEMSGDRILGAELGDTLRFEGVHFTRGDITVEKETGTGHLDLDGDGILDGSMRVEVDLRGGDFMVVQSGADTVLAFAPRLPALAEGVALFPWEVNGVFGRAFLTGDGETDFRLALREPGVAGSGAAPTLAFGVYEIDAGGNLVDPRLLLLDAGLAAEVRVTDVEAGHRLGLFLLGTETPLSAAQVDTFDFVDQLGWPASLADRNYVLPALDGAAVEADLIHSYAADLNRDLQTHVVSGVNPARDGLTLAFEASLWGGDRDFNDVIVDITRIEPEFL